MEPVSSTITTSELPTCSSSRAVSSRLSTSKKGEMFCTYLGDAASTCQEDVSAAVSAAGGRAEERRRCGRRGRGAGRVEAAVLTGVRMWRQWWGRAEEAVGRTAAAAP